MARVLSAIVVIGLALVAGSMQAQEVTEPLVRPELPKEWSRAIRGFRREHNFSVSYGNVSSHWRGHVSKDETVFSFKNLGHQVRFNYAFHLPLYAGFGYYLGTQTSVLIAAANKSNEAAEVSYGLPGLNSGLTLNLSDHLRCSAGLELGWQRIEKLGLPEAWDRKRISVTGETRTWHGQIDYFYELSWAFVLEYESSELSYNPTESLSLSKVSHTWSLGLLKHLI